MDSACARAQASDVQPEDRALHHAVRRSNAASFALWSALPQQGNFVFSPYAIRSALSLVYLAAAPGASRDKLRSLMGYPRDEDLDFYLLEDAVQVDQGAVFESANAVWFPRQLALRPSYSEGLLRSTSAEAHPIDFAAGPKRASTTINAWVSERTQGKIPEMFASLSPRVHVVLGSAACFFAEWMESKKARWEEFRTADGPLVVRTMRSYAYEAVSCGDYRAAMAGYRATSLVLVLVVPADWKTFRWDAPRFHRVWTSLQGRSSTYGSYIDLPAVTLRTRRNLLGVLKKLGVPLSDPRLLARFVESAQPMGVDAAIHEAFIEFKDTTRVPRMVPPIDPADVPDPPYIPDDMYQYYQHVPNSYQYIEDVPVPIFRADRPFYFLLVERNTGLITFMGQVTDPTEAGG